MTARAVEARRTATGRPSQRLRRKIDLVGQPFAAACQRLFTSPRIAELFPSYLIQVHTIIRTTVPLMEAGVRQAQAMSGADPVAAGVATYLARHVDEERDHDEWLLTDLEVLGIDRSTVLARVPSASIAALVGSQYYWVLHYHPVALLGYFAFSEGYPPSTWLIEDLIARTGFPRAAFRTMAKHGQLDEHHREELDVAIDSLPLTADHEEVLGISAMSGMGLLARSIEEVVDGG